MAFESDSTSVEAAPRVLRLRLPRALRATLIGWARAGYPEETCGLLIGASNPEGLAVREVRLAANLERSRAADRYVLDPEALLEADRDAREAGLEISGFWHSHPDSPAIPSRTDRAGAWGGYAYVIVSVEANRASEVRVWFLENGTFHEGEVVE